MRGTDSLGAPESKQSAVHIEGLQVLKTNSASYLTP